jgi:hypothetical protein
MPSSRAAPRNLLAYAWASPNTALGLVLAGLFVLFRARMKVVDGVVEVSGGTIGSGLASPALACPFRAITLGHVILATDQHSMDRSRDHEHEHVRQYERWGPFFLPAYLASSAWQLVLGRRCYRDNYFERKAYAVGSCGPTEHERKA